MNISSFFKKFYQRSIFLHTTLSGDLIAKKMVHEKIIKHLEDYQLVLENKLDKNLGSSLAVSPWINKYLMPKFSGHKRERCM